MQKFLRWLDKYPTFFSLLGALIGAFVGSAVVLWTSQESLRTTLDTTLKIARIQLMGELRQEFTENTSYRQVHLAIVDCTPLIPLNREDDGKPGYLQWGDVNSFLNFLDDLGYYWKSNILDLETVDQLFGSLVREAYLTKEIQWWITQLRNKGEIKAFVYFTELAEKLVALPEHAQHVAKWKDNSCTKQDGVQ